MVSSSRIKQRPHKSHTTDWQDLAANENQATKVGWNMTDIFNSDQVRKKFIKKTHWFVIERYAHSLFLGLIFRETSFNSDDGEQMIEKSEIFVKVSIPWWVIPVTVQLFPVWQDIITQTIRTVMLTIWKYMKMLIWKNCRYKVGHSGCEFFQW